MCVMCSMVSIQEVIELLSSALDVDREVASDWREDSPLYGAIPELDSMSVMTVLAAIEQKYDVNIEQADLELDTFNTVGSLHNFVYSVVASESSH